MQAHYTNVSHSVHEATEVVAFVCDGDKLHFAPHSSRFFVFAI